MRLFLKIILSLLLLIVPSQHLNAQICPVTYQECLDRDLIEDLRTAHLVDTSLSPVTEVEIAIIRILTRDGRSKDIADIVRTDCGAYGFAHFQPDRDQLGMNISSNNGCEVFDEDWRYNMMSVLYSDWSAALQLRASRRIYNRAMRMARLEGWHRTEDLVLAAIVANSLGPRGFRRIASENFWDAEDVADDFAARSNHKNRRVNYWRFVTGEMF